EGTRRTVVAGHGPGRHPARASLCAQAGGGGASGRHHRADPLSERTGTPGKQEERPATPAGRGVRDKARNFGNHSQAGLAALAALGVCFPPGGDFYLLLPLAFSFPGNRPCSWGGRGADPPPAVTHEIAPPREPTLRVLIVEENPTTRHLY